MRTRLRIVGAGSNELLLRVLNLFAQQGLALGTLSAVLDDEAYRIEVEILGGAPARIDLVIEKLLALVLVSEVDQAVDFRERVAA